LQVFFGKLSPLEFQQGIFKLLTSHYTKEKVSCDNKFSSDRPLHDTA